MNRLEDVVLEIESIFEDADKYSEIYKISIDQAYEEIKDFTVIKSRAVLGDKNARSYVINQYSKVLADGLGFCEKNINAIISFENILKNSDNILFEILLHCFDMSEVIDKYKLEICFSASMLKKVVENEQETINNRFNDFREKIRLLATLVYNLDDGQNIVDTLQHHMINEIGVVDKDYVYIIYKGLKIHLEFLKFQNKEIIINIQKKITSNAKIQYDEQNPTVTASKMNSNRITVAGFSATATDEDLIINERIFVIRKITLEEMKNKYRTIDDLIYSLLLINQEGRGSHLISGSDMGVGKSTFLLSMLEKVPNYWGIGILDTQDELQARQKYPLKNIITLIENPKRTIAEQFQIILKMSRDVLYIGEITKPDEISELINACLRLNAGVGATIHLLSPFDAVTNCRNLMMRTATYNDSEKAEEDIARGVDLVIHLKKLKCGRIIVDEIVEIVFTGNELNVEPKFDVTLEEKIHNLIDIAQIYFVRAIDKKCYRYNEIIKYDEEKRKWIPVNCPTEAYFKKISQYVSSEKIDEFKKMFNRRIESAKR
ncbi:MAG: CpaF/VirB11 family protein [Clostridiales bacterium]|nr:CpaF/VirB11 family protein [Clostridiales bacterium]